MQATLQPYAQVAEQARRNELIEANLGLVRHILGKLISHLPSGVDIENLESAGVLGLVEAANKFDAERGIKFETYAYTRIRGAILDELRRNCPIPQGVLEKIARIRKASESLEPGASIEDVAVAAGLSREEVADCLSAQRITRVTSWEAQSDPPEAHVPQRQDRPDELAEQAEQRRLLADAIEALPERERLVVTLYYMEDLRLKEIGRVLDLSESRVSRVLSAAEFTLRDYIRARVE